MTNNEDRNNKLNSEVENKIDLLLEQHEATQRAIAHLRADLSDTIKDAIMAILTKRAQKGLP